MSRFYEIEPTIENYWRAIVLFGRNTASYKFALANSLYDLYENNNTLITLDELAIPFAGHLCDHLKKHPKQIAGNKSQFLNQLKNYNDGKIGKGIMLNETVKLGFNNVIDAFHNVHGAEVGTRFFIDERKTNGGIRLTDDFYKLGQLFQFHNLQLETEARWNLVESAWENNISRNLMLVEYKDENKMLIGVNSIRRTTITSARSALNGYQKGRCFYCYKEISTIPGTQDLAEVDHFFPHKLKMCDNNKPIDGVANLVLSCQECNRGVNGKFDRLPTTELLERLFTRNEYLITSHHPLRETLIAQTGMKVTKRQEYLQEAYNCASMFLGSVGNEKWYAKPQGMSIF